MSKAQFVSPMNGEIAISTRSSFGEARTSKIGLIWSCMHHLFTSRKKFSLTTIVTTLSPCDVCAALIYMCQFNRVVIGDVTNASGNDQLIRDKSVQVDILEDQKGIALY